MTKTKFGNQDDGEPQKPLNNTKHSRAMKNPRVREIVTNLGASWKDLSLQRRGELLSELLRIGCSERGLARELHIPPSTIRRVLEPIKSEENGDWSGMWSTVADEPEEQETSVERAVVHRVPTQTQENRQEPPAVKPALPPKAPSRSVIVERLKKITLPPPIKINVPAPMNNETKGKAQQTSQIDDLQKKAARWLSGKVPLTDRQARIVAELEKPFVSRPDYGAKALGKNGRPVPPEND